MNRARFYGTITSRVSLGILCSLKFAWQSRRGSACINKVIQTASKNLQNFQGEESDECVIVDVVDFIVIEDSGER